MKGYFLKGMEEEAMSCYEDIEVKKMTAVAYNLVLDALKDNGKFVEGLSLFEEMLKEDEPPQRLAVSLGTFRSMESYKYEPDGLSYNLSIEQLCKNGHLEKGEEIFQEMGERRVFPDEHTYTSLMDDYVDM